MAPGAHVNSTHCARAPRSTGPWLENPMSCFRIRAFWHSKELRMKRYQYARTILKATRWDHSRMSDSSPYFGCHLSQVSVLTLGRGRERERERTTLPTIGLDRYQRLKGSDPLYPLLSYFYYSIAASPKPPPDSWARVVCASSTTTWEMRGRPGIDHSRAARAMTLPTQK
ncbi:hypothetical protein BHE74_00027577 [Ensete ventricosum]|nr:hypothetical protein BHE74_00027577 [Ensete ventricosum]